MTKPRRKRVSVETMKKEFDRRARIGKVKAAAKRRKKAVNG